MGRTKKELGLDSMGIQKSMRLTDYLGDGIGQLPIPSSEADSPHRPLHRLLLRDMILPGRKIRKERNGKESRQTTLPGIRPGRNCRSATLSINPSHSVTALPRLLRIRLPACDEMIQPVLIRTAVKSFR